MQKSCKRTLLMARLCRRKYLTCSTRREMQFYPHPATLALPMATVRRQLTALTLLKLSLWSPALHVCSLCLAWMLDVSRSALFLSFASC